MLTNPVTTAPVADRSWAPDSCQDESRFWFSADYLLWWVKKGPSTTPLVATGPASDAFPGVLDQPHTTVLFGGSGLNYDTFSGMRLGFGAWLDSDRTFGVEASGFMLEKRSVNFAMSGNASGQPYFGRPFIDALTGADNIYFVSQNLPSPRRRSMRP